nr:hypothetical protein [Allomuricauda sp.]|tara:strand:- start:26662 stop:27345 length:684 start_codon:yes stop_codon:yes gene_type:complete
MVHSKQLLTGLLSLLLLSMTSCQDRGKKNGDEKPTEEEPKTEMVKAPEGIISLSEAKSIYTNYTENRVGIIEDYEQRTRQTPDFKAARYADFDYETIKQYIAYIDQEAEKAGVEKVTKLRVYFANYPDAEIFDGKKVVHPKQNTLFMVPTLNREGENYGFFIGPDGKAELIKNVVQSDGKGMGSTSTDQTKSYAGFVPSFSTPPSLYQGGSLTLNHSGSGPPPTGDF